MAVLITVASVAFLPQLLRFRLPHEQDRLLPQAARTSACFPPLRISCALSLPSSGNELVSFVPSFKAAYRARNVLRDVQRSGGAPRRAEAGAAAVQYTSTAAGTGGARAIEGGRSIALYNVSASVPRVELVAMLQGLCGTGQVEAAAKLLLAFIEAAAVERQVLRQGATATAARRAAQDRRRGWRAASELEAPIVDERVTSIVLNSCAERGRMALAMATVTALRSHDVAFGQVTYCILVKGYGRVGDVRSVDGIFSRLREAGVSPDMPTYNALIDAYASNNKMLSAEQVLLELQAQGLHPSSRTYNTLIKGYARHGELHSSFNALRRMRRALGPSAPNEVTYNTLLTACVRHGRVRLAFRMLRALSGTHANGRPRPRANVWGYSTLLQGVATQEDLPLGMAINLLDEMRSRRIFPNAVTVTSILNACFDRHNVTAAQRIAASLKADAGDRRDRELAWEIDCAMVVGLCRQVRSTGVRDRQQVAEAVRLFMQLAKGKGATQSYLDASEVAAQRPPVRVCNAVLSALVSFGEVEAANKLLILMDSGATEPPNGYSLCLLMGGYGRQRRLREAAAVWRRLRESGLVDVVALNAWLQACAQCGQLAMALQAFQQSKEQPLGLNRTLDMVTFATLIRPLVDARSDTAATRALKLWAEMRARGIAPDRALVATMFRACVRSLGVEVALRIRIDLISLNWRKAQLAPFDKVIHAMLPSLGEIMKDEQRWASLGVRAAASLDSEVGELVIGFPEVLRRQVQAARQEGAGWREPQRTSRRRADAPTDAQFDLATPSEEIFERKGWNEMDGSWRAI